MLSVQPVHAQQVTFVPDVVAQFDTCIRRHLGFTVGDDIVDPTTCKHYEGIARLQSASGTPYFGLTRSGGYVPPCFLTDDEPTA